MLGYPAKNGPGIDHLRPQIPKWEVVLKNHATFYIGPRGLAKVTAAQKVAHMSLDPVD